jgi:uncharacterized membrane protein
MLRCTAMRAVRVQLKAASPNRTKHFLAAAVIAAGALLYQENPGGELVYEHALGTTSSADLGSTAERP